METQDRSDNLELKKISSHASEFRRAIERCDRGLLPITLQDFPRGACGDVVLLLAKYLQENNCGIFDYVLGQRHERSHAWLQRGDIIVDITADQFNDQKSQVIVTADNLWHSLFEGEALHIADIERYDEHTKAVLLNAYKIIKKYIGT